MNYKTFKTEDAMFSGGFLRKVFRPFRYFVKSIGDTTSTWNLRTITRSSWFLGVEGNWPDPGYALLSQKAYTNPYASRALFVAGQLMSSIDLGVFVEGDEPGSMEEVEGHPMSQIIDHPNPEEGKQAFINKLVAYIYLAGDLFFYFPGTPFTEGGAGGKPGELGMELIRPDRVVHIEKDRETGEVLWYRVVNRKGLRHSERIPAIQILHIKTFNPMSDDRGMPLMLGVFRALVLFQVAEDWNLSVSESRGRHPGFIKWIPPTPGARMDDERWKEFKERSTEQFNRSKKTSDPMYLDGNFDWTSASMSPVDADWLKSSIQKAKEIAIGMGFGVSLLTGEHATFNNLATDLKAAMLLLVLPLLDWWIGEINVRLMSRYQMEGRIGYRIEDIALLQEDMNERSKRIIEQVRGKILTPSEGRGKLGHDAYEWPPKTANPADVIWGVLSDIPLEIDPGVPGEPQKTQSTRRMKIIEKYLDLMLLDNGVSKNGSG